MSPERLSFLQLALGLNEKFGPLVIFPFPPTASCMNENLTGLLELYTQVLIDIGLHIFVFKIIVNAAEWTNHKTMLFELFAALINSI